MARATEESPAEEYLGAQRGGLAIGGQASSALKFPEQVEQQQDAAEGRFGGEEFLQTKIVRGFVLLGVSSNQLKHYRVRTKQCYLISGFRLMTYNYDSPIYWHLWP